VYQKLKAKGILCSENRVARLMRLRRLRSKRVRRYKIATKPNEADGLIRLYKQFGA
jgi:transposase InsO family protein